MRTSYFSNVLGLALIQGFNLVFPVLLIPIIVSVQGIEAYGQYAIVFVYYFFAGLVCDYGFDYSAVRSLKRAEVGTADRGRIIVSTLSAKSLLFIFAVPIATAALFWFARIQDQVLLFAGILLPLSNVVSVQWIYLAQGQVARLVIPIGLARLIALVAILLLYPRWPSVGLVMVLTVAPVLIAQLPFLFEALSAIPGHRRFDLAGAIAALRTGSTAFYVTFVSSYLAMSSVLAVSLFATAKEVGTFAAVDRLIKAIFAVAKPFLVALYPEMSKLFHEEAPKWIAIIRRTVAMALGLGLVGFLFIALGWAPISTVLFGHPIPGTEFIAYGLISWLTLGLVNNAIGIQGLLASGNDALYGRAASAAAVILTAGYFALGAAWSVLGIVFAILLAEAVFLGLNSWSLKTVRSAC